MYDYKRMDTAPVDGSVVMVLCGAKWPVAAYWWARGEKSVSDGEWRTAITNKAIVPPPVYWCPLPAQAPTDYLQSLEHLPFVMQGGVWPDRYSDEAQAEMLEKMEAETVGALTDKPMDSPGVPLPEEPVPTRVPNESAKVNTKPGPTDPYIPYEPRTVTKHEEVYHAPKKSEKGSNKK